MSGLLELKKQMEIDFLKSKSYEEINEMFNELHDKLKTAESKVKELNLACVSNNEVAVCCATCDYAGEKDNPCNGCFMHNRWIPQQTDC